MPLIWGKSDKPGQLSRLDVLGHRSPVASRLVTRPGEGHPPPFSKKKKKATRRQLLRGDTGKARSAW